MEPMNRPTYPGSPDLPPGPGADPVGPAMSQGPQAPDRAPAATDGTPPAWNLPPAPFPVPPVLPAPSAPAPSKRRRDPLTIVMVAAAFVALGGVGFAAGRVTAPATAVAGTGGRGGGGAFTAPGGSFTPGANNLGRIAGAVSITGTITEVTADHITLKLTNGSTITIPVDSNTAYHRQASATSTDLTTGTEVQVQLSAGANGGGGGGQQPGASGAPGTGGRAVGPASDITIVGQ
jgi:hypothetical protein